MVKRANAAKHQFDQAAFESLWKQREQEEGQVGQITHLAQHRGHDLPLWSLGHALNGGKQHDSLQNLYEKIEVTRHTFSVSWINRGHKKNLIRG